MGSYSLLIHMGQGRELSAAEPETTIFDMGHRSSMLEMSSIHITLFIGLVWNADGIYVSLRVQEYDS